MVPHVHGLATKGTKGLIPREGLPSRQPALVVQRPILMSRVRRAMTATRRVDGLLCDSNCRTSHKGYSVATCYRFHKCALCAPLHAMRHCMQRCTLMKSETADFLDLRIFYSRASRAWNAHPDGTNVFCGEQAKFSTVLICSENSLTGVL